MNHDDSINLDEEIPQPAFSSAQIVLILGGARSGKSAFAERLAVQSGKSVAYIATATAGDEDMRERIRRHQAARSADWRTIEEPLALANALREASVQADILLLDCITLWLSNWLCMRGEERQWAQDPSLRTNDYIDDALAEIENMLHVIAELDQCKAVIIVSNEVGLGVVPSYTLGRVYRDTLGRVNQRLASAAARVYLMIAGLGVDIKRLHDGAVL